MEDVTRDADPAARAQLRHPAIKKAHPAGGSWSPRSWGRSHALVVSPITPWPTRTPAGERSAGARQLMVTGRRKGRSAIIASSRQVWWVEGDPGVLELVKLGLGWAAVPEFLLHRPGAGRIVIAQAGLHRRGGTGAGLVGIAPARSGRRGAGCRRHPAGAGASLGDSVDQRIGQGLQTEAGALPA